MGLWIDRLSRAYSRSPLEISKRAYRELYTIRDRVFSSPLKGMNETKFSKIFNEKNIKNLYAKISRRPYPAYTEKMSSSKLDFLCPNEISRVFELAEKYKAEGMTAYSKIQEREFAREKDGYTSVKHQREVGTSYFDAVSNTISSGKSSTTAMEGSTESEQF